jgi:hypothetical protein
LYFIELLEVTKKNILDSYLNTELMTLAEGLAALKDWKRKVGELVVNE